MASRKVAQYKRARAQFVERQAHVQETEVLCERLQLKLRDSNSRCLQLEAEKNEAVAAAKVAAASLDESKAEHSKALHTLQKSHHDLERK